MPPTVTEQSNYLCIYQSINMRKEAKMGFKEIGMSLGGRDHSTVINACQKVSAMISNDSSFRNKVQVLRKSLR